jgi:hypothetical protein
VEGNAVIRGEVEGSTAMRGKLKQSATVAHGEGVGESRGVRRRRERGAEQRGSVGRASSGRRKNERGVRPRGNEGEVGNSGFFHAQKKLYVECLNVL